MRRTSQSQLGFTLIEILVVVSVIGVLLALLLPAIGAARETARRMDCSNRMKQISLGISNYESAYGQYPTCRRGSLHADDPYARIGGLMMILPFVEQQPLYEKLDSSISSTHVVSTTSNFDYFCLLNFFLSTWMMCPVPTSSSRTVVIEPWLDKVDLFRCPSDPRREAESEMGYTNYAFSLGDTIIDNATGKTRGMFESTTYRRHRDVTDGLSNTIFTGFNTILPPGDVSADHRDTDDLTYGNFAAGSDHAGSGVNCAFGDGSIRFITAQVDCGDLSQSAPLGSDSRNSPYGVWGSLGTIAAEEVVSKPN